MLRRSWLKLLGGPILVGPIAAACEEGFLEQTESNPEAASRGTILVIGAGMAGLAASRELRAAGFEVIVLEGRDRIGGRIRTDRSLGTPVDLGASWIHGLDDNPIADLADELNVRHVETDYDDIWLWDADGARVDDDELEALGEGMAELDSDLESIGEELERDVSVRAAYDRALRGESLEPREERLLAWRLSTIEVTAAEDLGRLSFGGDESESFGGADHLFPGGYHQLIQAVAQGITVHRGQAVRRIAHGRSGVVVRTAAGRTYRGDAALVTVPLGVLKRGRVSFSPALPRNKRRAIGRLGMGTLNKVALRFERRFWTDEPHFLGFASDRAREFPVFLNYAHYTPRPILMAFTGGSFARSIETTPEPAVVARIMRVLRRAYPAAPDPDAHVMTRWSRDPMCFGSYPHVPVGASHEDFGVLAEPVGDRLFFAGDGTEPNHHGNVHGAFLSGRREAARITEAIAETRGPFENPEA